MSVERPFRFGGGLFWADSAADWADGARHLEALGYDTLVIGDHFSRQFAPIPALLAAAAATSSLRVTCTVFDNDYRHPAALAKEGATLDVLSGGKLEFGLGAGQAKTSTTALASPSIRQQCGWAASKRRYMWSRASGTRVHSRSPEITIK